MKKLKSLLMGVLLMMGGSAMAQDVVFSAEDVLIEENGTGSLVVSLDTDISVFGWQVFLQLPEGITLAQYYDEDDEDWYYDCALSSRHTKAWMLNIFPIEGTTDSFVFGAFVNPLKALKDSPSEILTCNLKADSGFTSGTIRVYDLAVSDDGTGAPNGLPVAYYAEDFNVPVTLKALTGINSIDAAKGNGSWYTVDGRRLSSQPATAGVYVRDGQKVIVK